MPSQRKNLQIFIIVIFLSILTGCDELISQEETGLQASGVVETVEVGIASEVGGRVAEVMVEEGDPIQVGDIVFRMEDELFTAQRNEAEAALKAAEANLTTAQAALNAAQASLTLAQAGVDLALTQYQVEYDRARIIAQPGRVVSWNAETPDAFTLPVWYFRAEETLAAMEAEVENASVALDIERWNYESVIQNASNADLRAVEARLAETQAAYLVAEALTEREIEVGDQERMEDFIQLIFDTAEADLESAQKEYDKVLSETASDEVLEARARLAVAEERYETALDRLNLLQTGKFSLAIQAVEATVRQAEAVVVQAEANVKQAEAGIHAAERVVGQAQAAVDLIDVQAGKLVVRAAVSGVLMNRLVEPGEVIQPGAAVMIVGQLDRMTVTVYIPEDRYGQISVNDTARVTSDSFPGMSFEAVVTRIADRAEYTPRNVQTEEDRRTTVFAVELAVEDPQGRLKPGMPTDVFFDV